MHLSKWNGWTLHLGALVFGGWRYHRMSWVSRPEPDHSPSTKNIFRVIHCSTCCQPTLFCFWGGCTRLLTPLPCLTLKPSYRRCANATIRPPSIAEVKAIKVSRRWSLEIKSNIFGSSWKNAQKHSQFLGFFDAPSRKLDPKKLLLQLLPGGVVPMLFESPVQFHVGYLVLIRDGLFSCIFMEDPRGNRTRCTWVKKQDTNPDGMHHFFSGKPSKLPYVCIVCLIPPKDGSQDVASPARIHEKNLTNHKPLF